MNKLQDFMKWWNNLDQRNWFLYNYMANYRSNNEEIEIYSVDSPRFISGWCSELIYNKINELTLHAYISFEEGLLKIIVRS